MIIFNNLCIWSRVETGYFEILSNFLITNLGFNDLNDSNVSMSILCVWQKCRIKCVSIQNKHYFEGNKLFHSIIFVQNTLFNKTKLFV